MARKSKLQRLVELLNHFEGEVDIERLSTNLPEEVFVDRSSSRKVFVGKTLVVKLRSMWVGPYQNLREAAMFYHMLAQANPDLKHFAPVLAADPEGNWLVQKAVKKINKKMWKSPAIEAVCDRNNIGDMGGDNWLMTRKGPVIVDYGINYNLPNV